MRLNKYLADCGVASRRACDKLIEEGKVKINDRVAKVGEPVDENNDRVVVNGKRVAMKHKDYYIILHKPKGFVTTASDEFGRKTVMSLIDINARLFPVGRLDYDTEGLLLLTNDGALANKLMHPSNKINKVYIARISGSLSQQQVDQLENGVVIDGVTTAPAKVKVLASDEHTTRVEITITEGRNRQIKKMFEAVGREVEFLKRVNVGELKLGGLGRGKYRFLTEKEKQYILGLK